MKSIKEKAEAYDKVLEWATEAHKVCDGMLKEDLEHLFPELKESEDEMMIQYFKDLAPFDKADELYEKYGFSHKDAIAWLEKQGEHSNFLSKIQIGDKVTRNKDGVLVNLSQLKRIAKPAEEYNITGISSKNAQGKLGEMIKNLKPVNEVLEQKPDWNEKYIADVFEKVGLAKIAREQGNENLSSALQSALIELGKFIPQQTSTWSEEDERIYQSIMDDTVQENQLNDKQTNWLRDIKYRYFPQPKQEWSEEDESRIDNLCHFLEEYGNQYYGHLTLQETISWLKSLKERVQPKVELTQLDKNILEAAIAFVEQNDHFNCCRGVDKHTVLSALRSLRTKNTWKPSLAQLNALSIVSKGYIPDDVDGIVSLYNDLKKIWEE